MGMMYFEGYNPVLFRELRESYSHTDIENSNTDAEKDAIRKTRQEMFAIGYNWVYNRNIPQILRDYDSKECLDESTKTKN